MKPVVTELYVVKYQDKSKIKAFLDFSEYRLFGARIKVVNYLAKLSSRNAELSIETLIDSFKGEVTEIYDF